MALDTITVVNENEPIPEAATRGKSREWNRPAFYILETDRGEVYAGSTGSINKRLQRHRFDLENNQHEIKKLQKRFNEGDAITARVTYTESREKAYDLEQAFLDSNWAEKALLNRAMDARSPGRGVSPTEFNIQRIKETHTGKIVSEETRKRLSESNKGRTISDEVKARISKTLTGRHLSDETIEKIKKNAELRKGIPRDPEIGRRISEAKKGKGFPKEALKASMEIRCKKVICEGVEYSSYTEAAKAIGVTDVTIKNRVNNPNPVFSGYFLKNESE